MRHAENHANIILGTLSHSNVHIPRCLKYIYPSQYKVIQKKKELQYPKVHQYAKYNRLQRKPGYATFNMLYWE